MANNVVDLACYRAAKKRAERTQTETVLMDTLNALPGPRCMPSLPFIGAHADDEFTRDNRVDLRKLFMEE